VLTVRAIDIGSTDKPIPTSSRFCICGFAGGRRDGWHVVIITELWRFAGSKSEVRPTKSLRVIGGRSADVLSWMRKNRSAKLEMVTSPGQKVRE